MKLAGINIGLETVVILGAGIITGRWILPALVHGMASNKISSLSHCGIDGEIGGPPQPNAPCAFCWNYDCSTHSWHCGGC